MRKTFMVDQVSVKEKIEGFRYKARYPFAMAVLAITLWGVLCGMAFRWV